MSSYSTCYIFTNVLQINLNMEINRNTDCKKHHQNVDVPFRFLFVILFNLKDISGPKLQRLIKGKQELSQVLGFLHGFLNV